MIVVFCFQSFSSAVPALSHVNAAEAQALGRWFGAAARTRWSFFCSVTADEGVAVAVATAVAVAIDAVATTVAVAIDAVATAVAVAMIVAVVAMIVVAAVAMAVVAAVAKAEDIAFVA